LNLKKRLTNPTRCEHATLPVEVLPVASGKKIAHCLGCGKSGPACESSAEALAALRLASPHSTPVVLELAVDGKR
jgi:hypothetical protein